MPLPVPDPEQKLRRQKVNPRRVKESPVAGTRKVFPFSAEFNAVTPELPAHIVRNREPTQITTLRRVEIISQSEINGVQVEHLGSARADAVAIDIAAAWRWDVPILPIAEREPKIVSNVRAQNTGDPQ
jgi:hypothetical protein